MRLSRRDLLKAGLVASAAAALPVAELIRVSGAGGSGGNSPDVNSPRIEPFSLEYKAPPIAHQSGFATMRETGQVVPRYDIYEKQVLAEILPGRQTPVRTYVQDPNATHVGVPLGPTILAQRGSPIVVRRTNMLPGGVTTSAHLHGGKIASEDDGHPVFGAISPGQSYDHNYNNDQIAANLWYHDHAVFLTSENVYRGLAAFYVFTDDWEHSLGLPSGEFDKPIVIQDRGFFADGSLNYPHDGDLPTRQGAFGDTILVNGVPTPFLKVARRKYRFRILNGSNARIYNLRLGNRDSFQVVSSEHGFLPHPAETDQLFMSTAERYSIVIDFAKYKPGTRVTMINDETPDPFGDPIDPSRTRNVMAFDVQDGSVTDDSRVPNDMMHPGELEKFDPKKSVGEKSWRFERSNGEWVINGQHFDVKRVDGVVKANTVEIWTFENKSGGWLHPAHPHLVKFKILERNGGAPLPWETGFKDMMSMGANETGKVAMFFEAHESFRSVNGSRGLYPIHCHNVDHEDHDMMAQYRLD